MPHWLRKTLHACGVAYSALYAVVNDAVAVTLYGGYSRMSQAVSELSALALSRNENGERDAVRSASGWQNQSPKSTTSSAIGHSRSTT